MFNRLPRLWAVLALLALAACQPAPKVRPALWQVDGPNGQRAWLFGTIHALPRRVDWRSPAIDAALAGSDRIVLEVAAINDDKAVAAIFARLAHSPGHPSLEQRVTPAQRAALAAMLREYGLDPAGFANTESWAAALMLVQAEQREQDRDSGNGIDRAIAAAAQGKPIEEFEGAAYQLSLFDQLPEAEQRQLLSAVIEGAPTAGTDALRMEKAWSTGDMAAIAGQGDGGLLRDPQLRETLLSGRNRAWRDRLIGLLGQGAHPFVAVGAAHLAGDDGLPALLAARGYRLTRLQ